MNAIHVFTNMLDVLTQICQIIVDSIAQHIQFAGDLADLMHQLCITVVVFHRYPL